jgi:hypothetical protein
LVVEIMGGKLFLEEVHVVMGDKDSKYKVNSTYYITDYEFGKRTVSKRVYYRGGKEISKIIEYIYIPLAEQVLVDYVTTYPEGKEPKTVVYTYGPLPASSPIPVIGAKVYKQTMEVFQGEKGSEYILYSDTYETDPDTEKTILAERTYCRNGDRDNVSQKRWYEKGPNGKARLEKIEIYMEDGKTRKASKEYFYEDTPEGIEAKYIWKYFDSSNNVSSSRTNDKKVTKYETFSGKSLAVETWQSGKQLYKYGYEFEGDGVVKTTIAELVEGDWVEKDTVDGELMIDHYLLYGEPKAWEDVIVDDPYFRGKPETIQFKPKKEILDNELASKLGIQEQIIEQNDEEYGDLSYKKDTEGADYKDK